MKLIIFFSCIIFCANVYSQSTFYNFKNSNSKFCDTLNNITIVKIAESRIERISSENFFTEIGLLKIRRKSDSISYKKKGNDWFYFDAKTKKWKTFFSMTLKKIYPTFFLDEFKFSLKFTNTRYIDRELVFIFTPQTSRKVRISHNKIYYFSVKHGFVGYEVNSFELLRCPL